MAAVARLILQDFRSYEALDLPIGGQLVALVGENGAGKTNLLEALSLFAPGRGLRRADLAEMARQDGPGSFAVSIALADDGPRLGIGLGPSDGEGRRPRLARIDGSPAGSAVAFSEHVRLVWLTPDLDGLFRGSAGDRRRFLDRLVLAVDPAHATRSNALERALRSRNRILEESPNQGQWLDAVEREVAELGVASAADWRALRTLGGFPEPFFGASARQAKRWSTEHRNLLIRDELVSLERVDDVGRVYHLDARHACYRERSQSIHRHRPPRRMRHPARPSQYRVPYFFFRSRNAATFARCSGVSRKIDVWEETMSRCAASGMFMPW